ncbi:Uncharacterised protein [Candidatus Tiddalikarchaeum anstoanum]|nr:Uncharacterised protein [Candidatus Tiddalikarchaeum anstoanum]
MELENILPKNFKKTADLKNEVITGNYILNINEMCDYRPQKIYSILLGKKLKKETIIFLI